MAEVAVRAQAIDPANCWAWCEKGWTADPYMGLRGDDCYGARNWWVTDAAGPAVLAEDFMEAHPEVDWDTIRTLPEPPRRDWSELADPVS